jgi:hypothetical protein
LRAHGIYAGGGLRKRETLPAGATEVIEAAQSARSAPGGNGTVDRAVEAVFQRSSARRYRVVTQPGGLANGNGDSIRILSSSIPLCWIKTLLE